MTTNYLELLDYRRQVTELYRLVRELATDSPQDAWQYWRAARDKLFAHHPQSALSVEGRQVFKNLDYYDYNPDWRFVVEVQPAIVAVAQTLATSTKGEMAFVSAGSVILPFGTLDLYWLDQYGGGIFLPFRDLTGQDTTYGGGRYLIDTAKSADLGSDPDGRLLLDFNFAYNPSCHYDPQWTCPLSPRANDFKVRIEAGEKRYTGL